MEKRKKTWLNLIESKKSYDTFSECTSEHELNIASMDKKLYNYYLTDYAKVA